MAPEVEVNAKPEIEIAAEEEEEEEERERDSFPDLEAEGWQMPEGRKKASLKIKLGITWKGETYVRRQESK